MEIDEALAGVVASTTQPALGAIRLAWWREALERLDRAPAPPEPRLQAVADELLPRGVSGAEVARLEQGWAQLLDERPDMVRAEARGETLFGLAARLLGGQDQQLAVAGRLYAAADFARRGLAPMGKERPRLRFARPLRPLTGLSALAARDLRSRRIEPEATPGRAWTLLRHRLTGTIA